MFHLISFTYIAWVAFNLSRGYILEIQSFCHGRNRMMRSVYCKRQNCWIEGGPVGFAGSTESLYCAHSGWWGSLCAQTTVGWCAQSWWRIHNVAEAALYNTRSSQFIAFLLIHTGQKGKLLPRVRNTILLVSALLWLSYGESTVSLRSHTGRHKHSLEGSTTSGFFPGPGPGSPSHLGAKSFGPGGITGAPLPFVTDGGWW